MDKITSFDFYLLSQIEANICSKDVEDLNQLVQSANYVSGDLKSWDTLAKVDVSVISWTQHF